MEFIALAISSGKSVQEAAQRPFPELRDAHPYGGYSKVAGERNVVEPRNCNLFWNLATRRAQGFQRADCHVVIAGKDRVEPRIFRNQLQNCRFS